MRQDAARRDLAETVRTELTAAARVDRLEGDLDDEAAAVMQLADDDAVRAAYPVWLAHVRYSVRDARAALGAAQDRTAAARTNLADARAATRVIEVMQARRDTERQTAARRQEQAVLDEAGMRRGSKR